MTALLAERFELLGLAGAGGMGRIHQAIDRLTGERVAVKVLNPSSLELDRFEREGAVLAELRHPGIVRYVAHGRAADGEPYLAMEWLEGEDLSQRLKRRELSVDEAMTLARCAAEALHEAHRRGVVHRDVKPGNLFLAGGEVDRVKVLDFGVARVEDARAALTRTGFMVGTPGYMAPEQTRGEKRIDSRADVFSLGCVLFRCLTGRAPFVDESVLDMLLKVALEPAPRVRSIRADLPEALDALVDRMLAKSPAERPPDGGALAIEIAAVQRGVSRATRLSSRPPPAIGESEQRLVCVIVARAGEADHEALDGSSADLDTGELELASLAERYGGRLHILADGSLFVTLAGAGAATDQAVRAARCALALRKLLPGAPMALVAGRAIVSGWIPAGSAVDRGVGLLSRGSADHVRLDDVLAGLLDARFAIGEDASGRALLHERDQAEVTRVLLGKPTACVGRDAEIGRLLSFLDESVAEPMARAVLVTAPAGAGKSRLRHELLRRVRAARPEVEIWMGQGDLVSRGSPFALVGSALRRAAGVREGDPRAARQQQVLARLGRRFAGRELGRAAELLGEIMGVPFAGERARGDARALGEQMRSAWLSLLRAEAGAAPLLLVLEDLHWGDLPSISFVDAALRELSELPILILGLARPDVHEVFPRLWEGRALAEVKLGPLSRRAGERLVRAVLGEDAPAEVVEAIVARGAGNAFYIEELVRAVAEGKQGTLPETVLAMTEERLDRLDPEARRVLRGASVFGETFWKGGVLTVLGGEGAARTEAWLDDLAGREVIEPRGEQRFPGEEAYAFRHALVRDAAYAMLPEADRAAAHALAADWLERVGEQDALMLAGHFEQGGEPGRALGWYRRAAEQALEGNDLQAAIDRVDRAVACGAEGEARGELRVLQGEAHAWRGELGEAERRCAEAMPLLPRGGAPWCEAIGLSIMSHMQLGHIARFTELARELHEVDPLPDALDRFAAGTALVMAYLWTGGLYDLARSFMERTEGIVGRAPMTNLAARGWLEWARCCQAKYETGDPWRHRELARESVRCFEEAGDLRGSIRARMELGVATRNLGRFAAAELLFREALELSVRLGVHFLEAGSRMQLGGVLASQGRVDEARPLAAEAIASYARSGNVMAAAAARIMLAIVEHAAGELDAALEHARAAVEVLMAPPSRAAALGALAAVLLARGDAGEALRVAEEAVGLLRTLESIPEGDAAVRLVHAEALHAVGREDEARVAVARARARLLVRAAAIEDAALKQSFLAEVDVNRRTMERARAWVGGASSPPPAPR
jgi:tetratricopeptide (TPR) repeat protein